jgi:hypothetical protein
MAAGFCYRSQSLLLILLMVNPGLRYLLPRQL